MSHRTPAFVVGRLRQMIRERRRPGEPWWTAGAIELADRWLTPADVVVEFGSGRSTAWLARRAARVVSVEHHEQWHGTVSRQLRDGGAANAEVRLVADEEAAYVAAADDVAGVTFVVNDGRYRDRCARWAIDRLAPGGAMLLDDSQRYLDRSERFSKPSVPTPPRRSALWDTLAAELSSWRRLTYCDGVKDTTLLVRPTA